MQRFYWKLIKKSEQAIEEINQDMAYAVPYLAFYNIGGDMKLSSAALNDVVFLYGITDMIEKGLALVQKYVPNKGEIYSLIIRSYFFISSDMLDEDVMAKLLGMTRRRSYYREKKEALRMMGYYFIEMVIPQMHNGSYQPAVSWELIMVGHFVDFDIKVHNIFQTMRNSRDIIDKMIRSPKVGKSRLRQLNNACSLTTEYSL